MIPCLSKQSLKLLTATADERYAFSPSFFRETHFKQVLHEFYQSKVKANITEEDLLEELTELSHYGNRIFFVIGSTGSGKSELLCWLKDQWCEKKINRPVIRISRSELNPQVLI